MNDRGLRNIYGGMGRMRINEQLRGPDREQIEELRPVFEQNNAHGLEFVAWMEEEPEEDEEEEEEAYNEVGDVAWFRRILQGEEFQNFFPPDHESQRQMAKECEQILQDQVLMLKKTQKDLVCLVDQAHVEYQQEEQKFLKKPQPQQSQQDLLFRRSQKYQDLLQKMEHLLKHQVSYFLLLS